MVRAAGALLLVLTFLAAPARCEEYALPDFKAGDLGTGLHLGMALPLGTSGFSTRAGRAPSVSFRLTRFHNSWIAWGFELGTEMFLKHKTLSTPGTSARDAVYDAQAVFAGLFGRVNMLEADWWSPYLIGGGGLDRLAVKAAAPTAVCWPVSGACATGVNGSATGFYLTGGGGVELHIMRGATLSLEGRLRHYGVDGKKLTSPAESLSTTLGVTVWF